MLKYWVLSIIIKMMLWNNIMDGWVFNLEMDIVVEKLNFTLVRLGSYY